MEFSSPYNGEQHALAQAMGLRDLSEQSRRTLTGSKFLICGGLQLPNSVLRFLRAKQHDVRQAKFLSLFQTSCQEASRSGNSCKTRFDLALRYPVGPYFLTDPYQLYADGGL